MSTTPAAEICTGFAVEHIPCELRDRRQWVAWRVELRTDRAGKAHATKVPISVRSGCNASTTNPATWAGFHGASTYARRHGMGVGYVFAADDPFCGIDLDHCRDPHTGSITAWAHGILRLLDGYAEVSPSGTGVKMFIRAMLPSGRGKRRGPVEMYGQARFFAVTGARLAESPGGILDRQHQLDALIRQLFPPAPPTLKHAGVASVIADDTALVERAMNARNGAKFCRLWQGDWAGDYPSRSEADAALVAILAHWTACDAARIDALFRQSGLYREKWDRADYRRRTIERVLQ